MSAARRIQVAIYGRIYRLVGANPERTRATASQVDETMRRFSKHMHGVDDYQLAILTALHFADEAAAARGEFEGYRDRVSASSARIAAAVETALEGGRGSRSGPGREPGEVADTDSGDAPV